MDEMVPPWEMYPTYEHGTIGWRMGSGESYMVRWWNFIATLARDEATRLAYLKRHRPAPLSWAATVLQVFRPDSAAAQEYECPALELVHLLACGLLEYDVAYRTWLQQQTEIVWPYDRSEPLKAARYRTRALWFFARQLLEHREAIATVAIPPAWETFESELRTGQLGPLDPTSGLHTMVQMMCAGVVLPPWILGLSPESYRQTYELDMGFTDAYRLWATSAFDDDALLRQMLHLTGIPIEWQTWTDEIFEILCWW